jgi:hypothetical protein
VEVLLGGLVFSGEGGLACVSCNGARVAPCKWGEHVAVRDRRGARQTSRAGLEAAATGGEHGHCETAFLGGLGGELNRLRLLESAPYGSDLEW